MNLGIARVMGLVIALAASTANAGALQPSSVLVSYLRPNFYTTTVAGTLMEFSATGQPIQKFDVPWADSSGGGGGDLRGVAVGQDSRIYLFNGTFFPSITSVDPATGGTENTSAPEWGIINSISGGAVALVGNRIFATNNYPMPATYGVGGLIELGRPGSASTPTYFGSTLGYQDVTLGLDGYLYAINWRGDTDVFDPVTRTIVAQIQIPSAPAAIVVDRDGRIFGAGSDGRINLITRDGETTGRFIQTNDQLIDIDINSAGEIVVGSRSGRVFLTDTTLQQWSSFATQPPGWAEVPVHVAFSSPVPDLPPALALSMGIVLIALACARHAGTRDRARPA